MDLKNMISKQ